MAAIPPRSTIVPVGALLPSVFKTLIGTWHDYNTGLLGEDGTAQTARETLNVAMESFLLNPDGEVYQRAIAATADGGYMDDCWYALTQTGTITPSKVSAPEDGFANAARISQSQASAQRMGRAQIIEATETAKRRGKTVTFGGRFKASSTLTLRLAILAWTGTADAPTKDVVADWTSGSYTAGGFFNSTTLTVLAVDSASIGTSSSSASVSAAVPSNANNLIYFYWTEAAVAQNTTVDAWGQRGVEATTLVEYIRRMFQEELKTAKRFYRKSYEYETAPGTASTFEGAELWRRLGSETLTTFDAKFEEEMRAAPTVTWYNPNSGTSGQIYNQSGPGNVSVTGTSTQKPTSTRFAGSPTHSANGSLGEIVLGHYVADASLGV